MYSTPLCRFLAIRRPWSSQGCVRFIPAARPIPLYLLWVLGCCLALLKSDAFGADVLGYSVYKGQFLLQTEPDRLEIDPDFGFSVLASVDSVDFDLIKKARLRLPDGDTLEMDDLGDSWTLLDSYGTLEELDVDYVWGDYILLFDTVNDGSFSCLVELPEAQLPPAPRLLDFAASRAVDPGLPLELNWVYDAPAKAGDFVQVYINLGHSEVFSTPDVGEPGALDGRSTSVIIPSGVLVPGGIHGVNIEVTRILSTNSDCYPDGEGVGALFRSTEILVAAMTPPQLRLLSGPVNGAVMVEVQSEPGTLVTLEGGVDLRQWSLVATNIADSDTNVFVVPLGEMSSARYFRAREELPPAALAGLPARRPQGLRRTR